MLLQLHYTRRGNYIYQLGYPYYKNISEKLSMFFNTFKIYTTFKLHHPLNSFLLVFMYKYPRSKLKGAIYKISCCNCNSLSIGEKEHEYTFKKGTLSSKIVIHALDTDHIPEFTNSSVLRSDCNIYVNRIFLEGWICEQNIFGSVAY